ncbi:hypothetical protein like AT1G19260 [Hibiscus trionum]|uniref:TTF-type domain-containing protein n=1 Tax=Hibiscus trionum TaxID=183268 RepID=A0A9W7H2U5_HIBTR|nr:hypothetical protein like AT1G19260 [Hibiscus trionum]
MQDEIRRAYIKAGPYQVVLTEYPRSEKVPRRSFQASWLEYSPSKDAAFCLPCFLFHKEYGPSGSNAFTIDGFQNWKKVRDGKNRSFLAHIGKDHNSPHRNAEKACADLINQSSQIQKI